MFSVKNISSFIHPEGWKFALISILISTLFLFIWLPVAILGYLITLFIIWFFRDPERTTPSKSDAIYSPADGVICLIDESLPPLESELEPILMKRICVFMNVFNVHVNRSPIEGRVKKIAYTKGSFFNASLDKASEKNERNAVVIQTKENIHIVVVQIAGLIARRILSFIGNGHALSAGERFGLIRFGSRVDVYLPINSKVDCELNQRVVAGESVLASLS
tara:strand:+ start:339 stop:998 length:660 start_codon:yes stop_codon:yes gene_type:complete